MPAIIGVLAGAAVAEIAATAIGAEVFGSVLLGTVLSKGAGAIASVAIGAALEPQPPGALCEQQAG